MNGTNLTYKLSDDTWSHAEIEAINRVVASNMFTMGKEVSAFETQFATKMGSKYAVMSNSGSSANLLAVAALVYSGQLAAGDEVIVPAVSWSTTYFPLGQHNLKLRFVDIDKETLNIDVSQLEMAITSKTKAIMAVNLLGNPNSYDEILLLCKQHDLILIEDNCEALGGTYKGQYLGTFGRLGTFSTFYSHHLCTMEGGVTVTDDEELYHYMLSIRSHGWTRNLPENSPIYTKKDDEFYESFNFITPGYNLRPIEMEAAIGIEQLKKMDGIIDQRRLNAEYFIERIKTVDGVSPQSEIEQSSWFGFALILDEKHIDKRKAIVAELQKNNIDVRPIVAGNFTRNKAVDYLDYSVFNNLSNADYIHDSGFFIGNHSRDNRNQIDYFIEILNKILA